MWFEYESTHQNKKKTAINFINLMKFLLKYVVDKKSFIFYGHSVPLRPTTYQRLTIFYALVIKKS